MAYTTFSNITYDDDLGLALDVYKPNTGSNFPCIINVHGGGWYTGDKASAELVGQADRGYVVIAPNYRLTEEAPHPAQIHDIKGVVRWARANAGTYSIDVDRIGVAGFSAGGHLASLVATSGGIAALEGTTGGNLSFSSNVKVCVDGFGPAELVSMWSGIILTPFLNGEISNAAAIQQLCYSSIGLKGVEPTKSTITQGSVPTKASSLKPKAPYYASEASPQTYITTNMPAFYIFNGSADQVVPPIQNDNFADALSVAGGYVLHTTMEGQPHGVYNVAPIPTELNNFLDTKL